MLRGEAGMGSPLPEEPVPPCSRRESSWSAPRGRDEAPVLAADCPERWAEPAASVYISSHPLPCCQLKSLRLKIKMLPPPQYLAASGRLTHKGPSFTKGLLSTVGLWNGGGAVVGGTSG